jgi:hypothetical protein
VTVDLSPEVLLLSLYQLDGLRQLYGEVLAPLVPSNHLTKEQLVRQILLAASANSICRRLLADYLNRTVAQFQVDLDQLQRTRSQLEHYQNLARLLLVTVSERKEGTDDERR